MLLGVEVKAVVGDAVLGSHLARLQNFRPVSSLIQVFSIVSLNRLLETSRI